MKGRTCVVILVEEVCRYTVLRRRVRGTREGGVTYSFQKNFGLRSFNTTQLRMTYNKVWNCGRIKLPLGKETTRVHDGHPGLARAIHCNNQLPAYPSHWSPNPYKQMENRLMWYGHSTRNSSDLFSNIGMVLSRNERLVHDVYRSPRSPVPPVPIACPTYPSPPPPIHDLPYPSPRWPPRPVPDGTRSAGSPRRTGPSRTTNTHTRWDSGLWGCSAPTTAERGQRRGPGRSALPPRRGSADRSRGPME